MTYAELYNKFSRTYNQSTEDEKKILDELVMENDYYFINKRLEIKEVNILKSFSKKMGLTYKNENGTHKLYFTLTDEPQNIIEEKEIQEEQRSEDLVNELFEMSGFKYKKEFIEFIEENYASFSPYFSGKRIPGLNKYLAWIHKFGYRIKLEKIK